MGTSKRDITREIGISRNTVSRMLKKTRILWLSVGYPQINTSSHILFIVSFSFNVGLKILSFILVASLISPPFASEKIVIT